MIMHDEAGQSALQEALLEKGISMKDRKRYWDTMLQYRPM